MKLCLLEYILVNSPLRKGLQRWIDAPWFQLHRPLPAGSRVLEVGCGSGYGLKIILNDWRAAHVTGVDTDPRMLIHAQQTIQHNQLNAEVLNGEAEDLPFPACHFDAAVSFGAIHHVPVWQKAIHEVARTLKPGGMIYLNEYYAPLLTAQWCSRLLTHPPDRFTHEQLLHELNRQGLKIIAQTNTRGWWGLIIAQKLTPTNEETYE